LDMLGKLSDRHSRISCKDFFNESVVAFLGFSVILTCGFVDNLWQKYTIIIK
jgi:hypothetical protein